MTEDELDLLASAYLDGEVTSEEVAMVEADPELLALVQARVDELRPVAGLLASPVAPPPGLKEQHLTAAMAAFDDPGHITSSQSPTAPVSIDSQRDKRSAAEADRRPSRSMPQWLPAAAALLLIGGGAIWLAGRTGSDDTETASVADSATEGSDDAADDLADGDAARAVAADESSDALAESAPAAGADTDEESSDDAMGEFDEEAMEEEAEEDAEDAAEGEGGAAEPSTTTSPATTGGFFPQDPVASFDEVPDVNRLSATDLPDYRTDLSLSRCGPDFEPDPGSELVGHLPVEIAGAPAELLLVVDADGGETTVIVDDACEPLTP